MDESTIRDWRQAWQIQPTYYLVDTCAAEFEAKTPYYYSTYETPVIALAGLPVNALNAPPPKADQPLGGEVAETRQRANAPTTKRKIMILGGGPNRIGQGIEFDYCCVHAAFALRELGIQVIMVNSNPETVSTDYDT